MKQYSLADEMWREYVFGDTIYRINDPVMLYLRDGGTTHRVLDSAGVVHCIPAVGVNGCALRWGPRDLTKPVQF